MESAAQLKDGGAGLDQLRDDPMIQQWIKGSGLNENTVPGYLIGIRYFCRYTGKMPEQLIDEAEKEIMDGIPMRRRQIKQYLAGFEDYLKKASKEQNGREMAPKTRHRYKAATRSFYTYHEIPLPGSVKNGSAKALRENRQRLTKDMIEKALKYADLRGRAILLTQLSSGISDKTLRNLKVKDFTEGYDEETGITTLDLRRAKTGVDFITFLTPEASQAIQDYLEYRNRAPNLDKYSGIHKEYAKQAHEKRKVRSKDNYLFIHNFVKEEYLEDHDDEKRKMSHHSLQSMFRRLNKKAGFDKERNKHQWSILRGHNIRKLFSTLLTNEGVDRFYREFWMGHTIPEEQRTYFFASPEKLRKIYMKYMRVLEIQQSEPKIIETEEYKELKERNEELKKELEELKDSKELEAGEAMLAALQGPKGEEIAKALRRLQRDGQGNEGA